MIHKIHLLVKEATNHRLQETGNALSISTQLKLSRNMVSQYLNQLFSEGYLIKINTRPVLFYDLKIIEDTYGIHLQQREFTSLQAFMKLLQPFAIHDFDKLIGHDESLLHVVSQCKATISYPPQGLPLLLYGPTGCGKSYIAQLMYEYALNHNLIEADKKFMIVNCSEYANNPELLTANLFGHKKGAFTGADKDNVGLIKLAEGGVLFLDEVHCLRAECQEKLFLFMDKSIYHMVGDNETWYHSDVRLLFATTKKPEEVLLKTLLRRIPMIVTIPSLEARGTQERLQLLYTIFAEEEKRIQKDIYISTLVYQLLLHSTFPVNIGELKNVIQASCVNALFEMKEEHQNLQIRAYHLPEHLMKKRSSMERTASIEQQKMMCIHDLQTFVNPKHFIIKLHEELLTCYQEFHHSIDFYTKSFNIIEAYHDRIVLSEKMKLLKYDMIFGIVQTIFDMLSLRYGFKYVNNDMIVMSSYISDTLRYHVELNNWYTSKKQEVKQVDDYFHFELSREYALAKEIEEKLQQNLDIAFDPMFIHALALHLKMANRGHDINQRIGVIIAHGFSTASSIADAVNKFLGRYIFDAIDMPLHVSNEQIVEQLQHYLSKMGHYEELFLLVDMGSLEDIYKGIVSQNATIGIMNNVTTKMALEVAQAMVQGERMNVIFERIQTYSCFNYHILEHKDKDKVILCSCASGMGTAEKLKKILEASLPHSIPIKVLTYDYNSLLQKQMDDGIFDHYEVICIIGTLNPNLDNIHFIPIEDLIINATLDEFNVYFKDFISADEMKTFKQNILKNFSLSNIMNNLTILNPTKLLEHVADAIDKLQSQLDMRFANHTCFGLYVHVCCLIERLITHQSIDVYCDVVDFAQKEIVFIDHVRSSFSVVEHYYSVELPVEEIGYIYNYVKNN